MRQDILLYNLEMKDLLDPSQFIWKLIRRPFNLKVFYVLGTILGAKDPN